MGSHQIPRMCTKCRGLHESWLLAVSTLACKPAYCGLFSFAVCFSFSLLAGNATMISEDFNMTEVFTVLTEVIRDNFRNAKLKQHLLPALGEFLFYAATQEENLGGEIPQWDVPGNVLRGSASYR